MEGMLGPTFPDNPSSNYSRGRVCGPLFYQIGMIAERESCFYFRIFIES